MLNQQVGFKCILCIHGNGSKPLIIMNWIGVGDSIGMLTEHIMIWSR